MRRWARLTSAGRWGWQIEMLSNDESLRGADGGIEEFLTMVEERVVHAWTEVGARRKAQRMLRRRVARDRRQQSPVVVELDAFSGAPSRGTQTMSTQMATGYEPPSMSLAPPIKRIR